MLVAWILAASLNFSAFRWVALPWPAEAKFNCPGLARAWLSSSCTDLMFLDGAITSTFGVAEIGVTGMKSFSGSKGSLAKVCGVTVCEDE